MGKKIKIGLALGGGGARGLAHIGVLKALEEEKIPIDIIVGTSMGAVVGAVYSQNPDCKKLEQMAKSLINEIAPRGGWSEFLKSEYDQEKTSFLKELGYFVRKRYMYIKGVSKISLESEEKLMHPLRIILKDEPIENTQIIFAPLAIDLIKGEEVTLTAGPIIPAVYASSAIEGVFPPKRINEKLLSDGGGSNLVPVDKVRNLGADLVVAVDLPVLSRNENKFSTGMEIILRADSVARGKLTQLNLRDADVVITPQVQTIHWANFTKVDLCIQKGYEATQEKIPEIRKKISQKKNLWHKIRRKLGESLAEKR